MVSLLKRPVSWWLKLKAFFLKLWASFLWSPGRLKILLKVKTWLVFGLGASNVFVLGFVLNVYLQSTGMSLSLYATAPLEDVVKNKCRTEVERVVSGEFETQRCWVEMKNRHKGVGYEVKTKLRIEKGAGDGEIKVTVDENKIADIPDEYEEDLEAGFCEDCSSEKTGNNDFESVVQEIAGLLEERAGAAKRAVSEAKDKHDRSRLSERTARIKERRCEGRWDEDEEEYVEFDVEEALDCKMAKLIRMSPYEKDQYYNGFLKHELWQLAMSEEEDPYMIMDSLNKISSNPYHFSHSTRLSAGLIRNYVGWKDRYEELESDIHRDLFVRNIVDSASRVAVHLGDQGRHDLRYLQSGLNRDFDQAGYRLNSLINPNTASPSHIPVSAPPGGSIKSRINRGLY